MPPAATTIPARTSTPCARRCCSYLDRGYTVVKMKIGGAELAEDRNRVVLKLRPLRDRQRRPTRRRHRQRPLRPLRPPSPMRRCCATIRIFWYEEAGDPLDFALQAALAEFYPGPMATGEKKNSLQPPGRPQPPSGYMGRHGGAADPRPWLQFELRALYLRPLRISPHARSHPHRRPGHPAAASPTAATRCRSTSPPASGLAATRATPDLFQPFGGLPRRRTR